MSKRDVISRFSYVVVCVDFAVLLAALITRNGDSPWLIPAGFAAAGIAALTVDTVPPWLKRHLPSRLAKWMF